MDPEYFPPARVREIIDYLHKHDQRYGMFHVSVVVRPVIYGFSSDDGPRGWIRTWSRL